MADGRMLAKKISLNEAVASLENDMHRLLFTWGLSHLDIEGRISGSPKVFRAIVVPLLEHITSEKVGKFFKDVVDKELIIRYQVGKDWIIEYPKFKENQRLRPDREAPSKLPPPPDLLPTTPGELPEDSGTTPALSLSLREVKALSPPKGGNGVDGDFEMWWREYPARRKKGKPLVIAKWRQLKTSGKLLPLTTMLSVLRAQKETSDWIKEGGEFIPGPLPYLNKLQFVDDSIEQKPRAPARNPDCPRCRGKGLYRSGEMPDGSPAMKNCDCETGNVSQTAAT
jgi:hypothetical protein